MKYEFLHRADASKTAENISSIFGFSVNTQQTVSNLFRQISYS